MEYIDRLGNLYIGDKKFIPYYYIDDSIYTVRDDKIFKYLVDNDGSTLVPLDFKEEQKILKSIIINIEEERKRVMSHSVSSASSFDLFVPEEVSSVNYREGDGNNGDNKKKDLFNLFVPEEKSSARIEDIGDLNYSIIPKEFKEKFDKVLEKLPEPIRARAATLALLTLLSVGGGILLNYIVSDFKRTESVTEKNKTDLDKAKQMLIDRATNNLKNAGILDNIENKDISELDFSNININDSVIEVWAYSEVLSNFYPENDINRMTINNSIVKNIVNENGVSIYEDFYDYCVKNNLDSYSTTLKQYVILERVAEEEILESYNNGSINNVLNNSKKEIINGNKHSKPRRI